MNVSSSGFFSSRDNGNNERFNGGFEDAFSDGGYPGLVDRLGYLFKDGVWNIRYGQAPLLTGGSSPGTRPGDG